jgi:hypothetical protein
MPRMNDSPAASIAFWFASEIMQASATTVTSGSRCAVMKARMTGSIVLGLGPLDDLCKFRQPRVATLLQLPPSQC